MKKVWTNLSLSLFTLTTQVYGATGGSMPWETPLQSVMKSLTGPVAGYVAMIAVVVCGALLIFGSDFSGFARNLINVVIASAIILGASSLITNLFPSSGAIYTSKQKEALFQDTTENAHTPKPMKSNVQKGTPHGATKNPNL